MIGEIKKKEKLILKITLAFRKAKLTIILKNFTFTNIRKMS